MIAQSGIPMLVSMDSTLNIGREFMSSPVFACAIVYSYPAFIISIQTIRNLIFPSTKYIF